MEKLSLILWRERELLEALAYRLEVEQLVLAGGRTRWLAQANREVESVLLTLRETEVLRSMAADETAAAVGLTVNPSLGALAEVAAEPWRTILLDHRDALLALTHQIAELSDVNKGLISAGLRSAQETLLAIRDTADGFVDGYTAAGGHATATPAPRFVDRSL